jgi:CheY-like chemotaxis protein
MEQQPVVDKTVILLAEDEPMIRNTIREVLADSGYFVLDAADGQQAVELSRRYQGKVDLLLTDVKMPNLDGVTAAKTIAAERPGIRVLLISGYGDEIRQLIAAQAFLDKPFVPDQLREKIREVLAAPPPTPDTVS